MKKLNFNLTKTLYRFLPFLVFVFFLAGCEEKVEAPDVCYEITTQVDGLPVVLENPITINAGQGLYFRNCAGVGAADHYAFFAGKPASVSEKKPGSEYDVLINLDENSTKLDSLTAGRGPTNVNGDFYELYSDTGEYTATILLTSRGISNPLDSKQAIIQFDITVVESSN